MNGWWDADKHAAKVAAAVRQAVMQLGALNGMQGITDEMLEFDVERFQTRYVWDSRPERAARGDGEELDSWMKSQAGM